MLFVCTIGSVPQERKSLDLTFPQLYCLLNSPPPNFTLFLLFIFELVVFQLLD